MSADLPLGKLRPKTPTPPAPAPGPAPAPPTGWLRWVSVSLPVPNLSGVKAPSLVTVLVLVLGLVVLRDHVPLPTNLWPFGPIVPASITSPLDARLIWSDKTDALPTALFRSDATLAPSLKTLDCSWGWLDPADAEAVILLMGKPSPAVVVTQVGSSTPLVTVPFPTTPADVLAKVKALRGTK